MTKKVIDITRVVLGLEKEFNKSITDAIYNEIFLSEFEYNLIQLPIFSRLKRIKQLGPVNNIYFCANHTRFEHSIGTLEITWRMLKHLLKNNSEIFNELSENELESYVKLIRICALLHDLGHGSYSHALEESLKYLGISFDHDLITLFLVGKEIKELKKQDSELLEILLKSSRIRKNRDKLLQYLSSMFSEEEGKKWLERIPLILTEDEMEIYQVASQKHRKFLSLFNKLIKGDFGSDRLDYLFRDTNETGIGYRPNLDEVISSLTVCEFKQCEFNDCSNAESIKQSYPLLAIAVKRDTISSAEFLLASRLYHYNLIVYEKRNSLFTFLMSEKLDEFIAKSDDNLNSLVEKCTMEGDAWLENNINLLSVEKKLNDSQHLRSFWINDISFVHFRFLLYIILTSNNRQMIASYLLKVKNNIRDNIKESKFQFSISAEEICEDIIIIPSIFKPIPCKTFIDLFQYAYKKETHLTFYSPFLIDHSFLIRKGLTKNAISQTRIDFFILNKKLSNDEIEQLKMILNMNFPISTKQLFQEMLEERTENYYLNDLEYLFFLLIKQIKNEEKRLFAGIQDNQNIKIPSEDYSSFLLKLETSIIKITDLFVGLEKDIRADSNSKKLRKISSKFKSDFVSIFHPYRKNEMLNECFPWNWSIYEKILILDSLGIFELKEIPSEGYDYNKKHGKRVYKHSYAILPYKARSSYQPTEHYLRSYPEKFELFKYPSYIYEKIVKFMGKSPPLKKLIR